MDSPYTRSPLASDSSAALQPLVLAGHPSLVKNTDSNSRRTGQADGENGNTRTKRDRRTKEEAREQGGGGRKNGNRQAENENEPARTCTESGVHCGKWPAMGEVLCKGREERDSGTSAYRTYATNKEGKTPALCERRQRRPEPLAQHYA